MTPTVLTGTAEISPRGRMPKGSTMRQAGLAATGTGKLKVLSLVLAWSFYHKLYEPDSELAWNFLVVAPNIIVLDRIYKDFQGLRIFLKDDPVLPDNGVDGRNWLDDFQLTLHVQDEVGLPVQISTGAVLYSEEGRAHYHNRLGGQNRW